MKEASGLAQAGVQPDEAELVRVCARFAAAHKLFYVAGTLKELRATPLVNVQILAHYEREHARLARELGIA